MLSNQQQQASQAHERVMLNLAVFHLVLPVAALSTGYLIELLIASAIGSIGMLILIFVQSKRDYVAWVADHWRVAWIRCRILLIAYIVSALILLIGYLIGLLQADHQMASIFLVVFSRIAVVPTLVCVLVLFVLETSALSQAKLGIPISGPFSNFKHADQ